MSVVIVTGGSRGIGAQTAKLAAKRGYRVCINYANDKKAAESVLRSISDLGGRAIAVRADIALEHDIHSLFDKTEQELGPLTALVNNAGILLPQTQLREMTSARLAQVFAVNVTGSFICAREAVRRMSTKSGGKGGAIVNVSSIAAKLGAPNEYIDYAASKAAIDAMTVGLAAEVATESIRVNAVRPGIINTSIHASGGEPNRIERVAPSIPLKRAGEPSEVASTILYLLSDEASYVTGAILDVSGGR